ncbi:MAG TPA: hypothetical protein VJ180_02575, partial [Pyrinomonadaceae bacterium]|nr:hypothetical protein [Pyrinomonadaceae bacterium]
RDNEEFALRQKDLAVDNAAVAKQEQKRAEAEAENAREAEAKARDQERLAKAQSSASKAQIYQSRPGELYTSTLLAIDSLRREPSDEAEAILRQNISLLPIPVQQMAQRDRINAMEFSPGGEVFVTASADHTVCAWRVEDGEQLFCETSSGSVNDAAFSPNGELIATGDETGHVMILDAKDGSVRKEFDLLVSTTIWDVDISPDGRLLAVAREDAKVTFYDLQSPSFKIFSEFTAPASVRVSAFSPDDVWFAAGSANGSVTLWPLAGGKALQGPGHRAEVLSLEFSPSSRTLVSGGADSIALVTETSTGDELFRITNEDWVQDIAFSPDSSWFVTVSADWRVRVWGTRSGKERLRMLQESRVTEVQVSSDGQWIATTGEDRTIRLWNAFTGAQVFQIPLEADGSRLAFSQDEKYLVSGDGGGGINIWNISNMFAPTNYIQFPGFTKDVQFSLEGDWLAAADENRVWLLNRGQSSTQVTLLQEDADLKLKQNVEDLLISPDSKWIGIATTAGELILYDVQSGRQKTIMQSNPAPSFVFSPDSLQIFTADQDGRVQAWDVSSGELVSTLLEDHPGAVSLAVSNALLAIGMHERVLFWDWNEGQQIQEIASTGDHRFMAFSPSGELLAAAGSFGQIYIWQQKNGIFELLHTLTTGEVFSLAFNPQGDQLLAGGRDVVYVFDPLEGVELARIRHEDAVNGLSFSPDGTVLATASVKVVQFWKVADFPIVHPDDLRQTACKRVIRNFDQAEWTAFFGEEDEFTVLCNNLEE